jgi:hypothetical protein
MIHVHLKKYHWSQDLSTSIKNYPEIVELNITEHIKILGGEIFNEAVFYYHLFNLNREWISHFMHCYYDDSVALYTLPYRLRGRINRDDQIKFFNSLGKLMTHIDNLVGRPMIAIALPKQVKEYRSLMDSDWYLQTIGPHDFFRYSSKILEIVDDLQKNKN